MQNFNLNFQTFSYHKKVSLVKSGVRIVGYLLLLVSLPLAVLVLVLSEALGVLEELKEV